MRRLLIALAALIASAQAPPEPRWRALNREGREAIVASDYTKLRAILLELKPLMPGNSRIAYNLAAAAARMGDRAGAVDALRRWTEMGLIGNPAADEDFAALKDSAEMAAVTAAVERHKAPVTHSDREFALSEPDLIAEDLDYDSTSRRFFVTSVRKKRIVARDASGERVFYQAKWPMMAVRVDRKRKALWVTTGWAAPCDGCSAEDKDKTALLEIDLKSAELRRQIDAPVPGLLGDMTLGRSGTIYVTESVHGAVLRYLPDAALWERLDTAGEFPAPQTPAVSPDERKLWVPDYLRGIAEIDLRTKAVRWVDCPDGVALNGIDGLYLYRGGFLAVQNGTAPPRVQYFRPGFRGQVRLEANWQGLGDPTHGVLVNEEFHFLANSGWDAYGRDGARDPKVPPVISEVRRIRLRQAVR